MKYVAALFLVVGLSASPSAQNALAGLRYSASGPVSFRFHNATLGKVLHVVGSAAGVTILIDSGVDTTQPVDLAFNNAPIADVLNAVVGSANAKLTVISPTTILLQPR